MEKYFIAKLEKILAIEKDLGLKSNSVLYTYCRDVKDTFRSKTISRVC